MIQFENEGFLTQLGYPTNEANMQKLQSIIDNTEGFEYLERHVIQLNDHLKNYQSYITISNSKDFLKIKKDTESNLTIQDADEVIQKWADKYKVELIYSEPNNSYYIAGRRA